MMMMMMEDAIKTEDRSMENEMKFDDKLPLTTENFIEIEKQEQIRQQQQQEEEQEKWDISANRRDNDNTFSNALNINTQQQKRRQIQEAETIALHNNSSFSKSKNSTTATNNHANSMNYASKRAAKAAAASAVGTRCGEIFVANSGRKWTFICTYCNKSTRDIGAFILHLKKMHLNGIYTETSETEEEEEEEEEEDFGDALSFDERACNTSGHEQDVRKCNKQNKKEWNIKFCE